MAKSHLERWAEGKAPLVAMIPAQVVRMGEEVCDWLLREERGRGLALPARVRDVDEWQKLAGHASISTTVKHYTGTIADALRSAQECLPFHGVLRTYRIPLAGEWRGGLGEALLRHSPPST